MPKTTLTIAIALIAVSSAQACDNVQWYTKKHNANAKAIVDLGPAGASIVDILDALCECRVLTTAQRKRLQNFKKNHKLRIKIQPCNQPISTPDPTPNLSPTSTPRPSVTPTPRPTFTPRVTPTPSIPTPTPDCRLTPRGCGPTPTPTPVVTPTPSETPCLVHVAEFWKANPETWSVNSLKIGNVIYTKAQLLQILNEPVNGRVIVSLAHELIAGKLNLAQARDCTCVCGIAPINNGSNEIGNRLVPPFGTGYLNCNVSWIIKLIKSYNDGTMHDGCPPVSSDDPPSIDENPCPH